MTPTPTPTTLASALLRVSVVALVVSVVSWALGVRLGEAILIAAVVMAIGAVRSRVATDTGTVWSSVPSGRDLGVRRDISWLAMEVAGSEGRTTVDATHYVSDLARRRLDQRGVRMSQRDRAASLIGPLAYSVAIEPPSLPLRHHDFERCVVALERLDSPPDSGGDAGW